MDCEPRSIEDHLRSNHGAGDYIDCIVLAAARVTACGVENVKSAELKRNESDDPIYDDNMSERAGSMTRERAKD